MRKQCVHTKPELVDLAINYDPRSGLSKQDFMKHKTEPKTKLNILRCNTPVYTKSFKEKK